MAANQLGPHPWPMRDERAPGDDDRRRARMPRTYRDPEDRPAPASVSELTLEVDGEAFDVRVVLDPATGHADTGYTWLTGPNEGYGFGTSGPPAQSLEEHRKDIQAFLAMVDPATGYIEDD